MDTFRRLEEIFAHFPGIGPRQARRFVYYLLSKPPSFVKEFTTLMEEVKKSTAECEYCHRIFISKPLKSALCPICADENRDQSTLMVLARDSDFESVEKSGAYNGLYFILGGTVPILDKQPEKRIRLKMLLERITTTVKTGVKSLKEVILSLNTTPEGENTTDIVRKAITESYKKSPSPSNLKVTILGRGLSTGAELEYMDSETIKNALTNRH